MLQSDSELIASIRAGDSHALHELLLRYRPLAVRWAATIARDSYLAEDIAQEALLQVAANLDQLEDPAKFSAWLRMTVRRQALNHVKRQRREITSADAEWNESAQHASGRTTSTDPQDIVEHQITVEQLLSGTTQALSARDGAILLAVAGDARTEELVERFAVSRANLYNIISRSRTRAGEEQFRAALEGYLKDRRRHKLPRISRLSIPAWSRPYSMFGIAVHAALQYASDYQASLTETLGLLGDPFRLSVTTGCHWRGISTFDWTITAQRGMERLGREPRIYSTRRMSASHDPERSLRLLRLIHQSIDEGMPVVVWNLVINEFGLLYGYDDAERQLLYRGFRDQSVIFDYWDLSRNHEQPELFALAIGRRTSPPATDGAIMEAIRHYARGDEPPMAMFEFGLKGYALWRTAAESGTLDPLGHAYQVAIVCEAREQAVGYLRLLSERARTSLRREGLLEASLCYEKALRSLYRLYPSFPFGYGVDDAHSGSPDTNVAAALTEALQAEQEAIRVLSHL